MLQKTRARLLSLPDSAREAVALGESGRWHLEQRAGRSGSVGVDGVRPVGREERRHLILRLQRDRLDRRVRAVRAECERVRVLQSGVLRKQVVPVEGDAVGEKTSGDSFERAGIDGTLI